MSPQTKNIAITAGVLAILVTILVLMNTPSAMEAQQPQRNKTMHLVKVFIVSFFLCGIVLYIMQDNDQNAMMTNIIKGDPDF